MQIVISAIFSIFAPYYERPGFIEMSYTTRQAAFDVLHGLRIEERSGKWTGHAYCRVLKTDLMMWNRDIDIHVYSGTICYRGVWPYGSHYPEWSHKGISLPESS
jgi:hypothetical protein